MGANVRAGTYPDVLSPSTLADEVLVGDGSGEHRDLVWMGDDDVVFG